MTTQSERHQKSIHDWLDVRESKGFIAADFLLWLWFHIETETEPLQVHCRSDNKDYLVKIWIDDRLVLESDDARAHVQTLKGGNPSRSIEASSALRTGKSVKELKVGIQIEPFGDFLFILDSRELAPRAIHLPQAAAQIENTPIEASLTHRLTMTELLSDTIDTLFLSFISKRVEDSWWTEALPAIETWITDRGHSESDLH